MSDIKCQFFKGRFISSEFTQNRRYKIKCTQLMFLKEKKVVKKKKSKLFALGQKLRYKWFKFNFNIDKQHKYNKHVFEKDPPQFLEVQKIDELNKPIHDEGFLLPVQSQAPKYNQRVSSFVWFEYDHTYNFVGVARLQHTTSSKGENKMLPYVQINISRIQSVGRVWLLNQLDPRPDGYQNLVYQLLLWRFSQRIFNVDDLTSTLSEINTIIENNKKKSFFPILTLQNLTSSVLLLLEMIKNKPSFLKEDAVLHEYERIMENSILKWQARDEKTGEFVFSLKIFQYLLKYTQDKTRVIEVMEECARGKCGQVLCQEIKNEAQFRELLKVTFTSGTNQQKHALKKLFSQISRVLKQ